MKGTRVVGEQSDLEQRVEQLERDVEELKRSRTTPEDVDRSLKAAMLKVARDTRLARIARGE